MKQLIEIKRFNQLKEEDILYNTFSKKLYKIRGKLTNNLFTLKSFDNEKLNLSYEVISKIFLQLVQISSEDIEAIEAV